MKTGRVGIYNSQGFTTDMGHTDLIYITHGKRSDATAAYQFALMIIDITYADQNDIFSFYCGELAENA